MAEGHDLVTLAARLAQAKRDEAIAKETRISAEEAIIALTGFKKAEGQESFDRDLDHGSCKLILKQPINTTVDSEAWLKLRRTLPPKHPGRAVFSAKYSLDKKAATKLQEGDKKAWAQIASVIKRAPGKVSVELKEVSLRMPTVDARKRVGVLGPAALPPVTPPDEAQKQGRAT